MSAFGIQDLVHFQYSELLYIEARAAHSWEVPVGLK